MILGVIDPKELEFEIENWVWGHRVALESKEGQKWKGSAEMKILGHFFQAKVIIQCCRARQKKTNGGFIFAFHSSE